VNLLEVIRRPWIILSILWVLGLVWTTPSHLQLQNPWRWETAIHHVPRSVLDLFVSSKTEGRIPIDADGWETYYLPPDTDPATVAKVKAALDYAMEIEIEAEKPWWYLGRVLVVVVPCFFLFLADLGVRGIRRYLVKVKDDKRHKIKLLLLV
jgi:hypothetical protein